MRLARCQYTHINTASAEKAGGVWWGIPYQSLMVTCQLTLTHLSKSHQWQKVRRHSKHTVPPDTLQCRSVISGVSLSNNASRGDLNSIDLYHMLLKWNYLPGFSSAGEISQCDTVFWGKKRTKWNYPLITPKLGYLGVSQSRRLLKSITTCWLLLPQSCQFFFCDCESAEITQSRSGKIRVSNSSSGPTAEGGYRPAA